MKILIEGHTYQESLIKDICGDFEIPINGLIKVSKIGYYFNPSINDCVVCLPKIVIDSNGTSVLGGLTAEELINVFSVESTLNDIQKDFVQSFSLWSYRTISTYARLNPQSSIISHASSSVITSEEEAEGTLLDIILAIIRFYNRNKDYFMYIIKNLHSGYNRINWRKTISSKEPILQNGVPIYLDVVNRKKQINFDEELMVIFYSILNYISNTLGLIVSTECNYDLITGAQFEAYMDGLGQTRLRAIKYKYFSDKDLELWKLCYAFFEKTSSIQEARNISDYLLVSNFQNVFEAMIDALISDNDLPDLLKNQEDGKIVDHIFKYKSPIDGKDIYYIGDSKYYSIGSKIGDNSIYKQFTYAKNIIQYHFIQSRNAHSDNIRYRDELTEGYNFTPNFFISAYVPDSLTYESTKLKPRKIDDAKHRLFHFSNRLFDRDTLWLTHFDINLLFIMMLYAQNDTAEQSAFKNNFIQRVWSAFRFMLFSKYTFYKVEPKNRNIKTFVKDFFYLLNGKIYSDSNHTSLYLALETTSKENNDILEKVQQHAQIKLCSLSDISK